MKKTDGIRRLARSGAMTGFAGQAVTARFGAS